MTIVQMYLDTIRAMREAGNRELFNLLEEQAADLWDDMSWEEQNAAYNAYYQDQIAEGK